MARKKLTVGILSTVMALTMCMGTGMTTFAVGGDGTPAELATDATAAISKTLVMDPNVTTPTATFQFTISKASGTVTDTSGTDISSMLANDGPDLSIADISYVGTDAGTTGAEAGLKTVKKTMEIKEKDGSDLTADDFTHAGYYAYTIKEVQDTYTTAPTEIMAYSDAEYTIFVEVINDEKAASTKGLRIASIQGMKTFDNDGSNITDVKVATGVDNTQLDFRNVYSKNSGLTISKTVTGDLGSHTQAFPFSLTLTKPAILNELEDMGVTVPDTYSVTLPNGDPLNFEFGDDTATASGSFSLKHGESISFSNLPVGMKYTLSENNGAAITHYNTYITGQENGTAFEKVTGVTVSDKLVGEEVNKADVENNYSANPITGIVSNNLPFIVLIGAAIAGFAAYLIIKRRRFVR